jgi:hypothetical protein
MTNDSRGQASTRRGALLYVGNDLPRPRNPLGQTRVTSTYGDKLMRPPMWFLTALLLPCVASTTALFAPAVSGLRREGGSPTSEVRIAADNPACADWRRGRRGQAAHRPLARAGGAVAAHHRRPQLSAALYFGSRGPPATGPTADSHQIPLRVDQSGGEPWWTNTVKRAQRCGCPDRPRST